MASGVGVLMHGKQSFWTRVADLITGPPECVTLSDAQAVRVTERGVRIALDGHSFEVTMGKRRLHVSPDLPLAGDDRGGVHELIVSYPDRHVGPIGHFARLAPGATLDIDPNADGPARRFIPSLDAVRSAVRLRHEGDSLVLKATPEPESFVARLEEAWPGGNPILAARQSALRRTAEIYGGIPEPLAPGDALALLRSVIQVMESEPYRTDASDGAPGGIVALPAHKTPIVVGDLHGRVENLLTVLSQNAFLEGLEKEQAALVFLGDAVHPEDSDGLEDMESSVLIMDLIFRLKVTFPTGVFFLLGNHDSFSAELMKDGVPQGMLWDRRLTQLRGAEYRDEMQRFYSLCPLLLVSDGFVACHAGAPRMGFTRQMLVDVRQHPALLYELTWNRQNTRGHAGGYTGTDVRRLLHVLGMPDDSTFIVGHYPRSDEGSVWLDAGGIARHHVLVSSRSAEVAVMTRVDGEFVAQMYTSERAIPWLNEEALERQSPGAAAGPLRPCGPHQENRDAC